MKKWQNLAPPDDPGSWFDVDGVWPTKEGSYETCDFLTGTEYAATGVGTMKYAWVGQTLSATREFAVEGSVGIWEYSGGVLTDRTGGVSVGVLPMFSAYGDVIIAAMGSGTATCKSTGANFSALAGAPQANIIVTQSNAVLAFNTNAAANGWAASDVGDYTNWATGEYASGTIYQTPGAITAAVPFGNDVIVFKENAIYRMRYVGGIVKWTVELLVNGIGCVSKYACCPGRNGILFYYQAEFATQKTTNPTYHFYWFDGVSYPRLVNPLTALNPFNLVTFVTYDSRDDVFTINSCSNVSPFNRTHFYCPTVDAWGQNVTPITNTQTAALTIPVMGDFAARASTERSPQPVMWGKESANKLKRYSHGTPVGEIASACYVETMKIGKVGRKTLFDKVVPVLRRRVSIGANTASLTMSTFREVHDTTAVSTPTTAESTVRKRFETTLADNFVRAKVTWTGADVEIDDISVRTKDNGED